MPAKRQAKKRKREITISQGEDGYWHAWVTVGKKPGGAPDRRHVKRPTEEEAAARVDEILDQVREQTVTKPGRASTLKDWLEVYLDTVAPRRCDPGTIRDYRSKCRLYVYPIIGSEPLNELEPEHLDAVYTAMDLAGLAPSTQLKVHRILSRALSIALRRRAVSRNVAKLMDAPSVRPVEQRPLTTSEAARVLTAAGAEGRRLSARWAVGLALGLRQGEALGLRWQYVDLERKEMRVWWQLRRRTFEHGCQPACGRRRGGNCPERRLQVRSGEILLEGGLILKEPKGTGKRTVPIPDELAGLLRQHRAGQLVERALAGELWQEHDLVFTHPDGRPIDPGRDHDQWAEICAAAGVEQARLHDGRHTAGTMMLALGADIATVQEILGHSDVRTTRGYVHVASEMSRAAAGRLSGELFGTKVHPDLHP